MNKIKHITAIVVVGVLILGTGIIFNIFTGVEYLINKINK